MPIKTLGGVGLPGQPPAGLQTSDKNGRALDERQKKTAKEEVAALAKSGDYEAAFHKILELI